MNELYRGFNLYGGSEPFSETLLGRVTHWKPTGCIAYKRRDNSIVELTRFRFPMTLEDETVAECFGLETARLVLDACYRDFAIARYETEKKLIQQRRGGRSVSCGMQILPVSTDKDPQESELCAVAGLQCRTRTRLGENLID